MRVLVACEFSGRVRDAFISRGYDAVSCDLLPTESPGPHIQGDVLSILGDGWGLAICHPPCTYLSYAALGFWDRPGRAEKREEAMAFFMALVNAPIPFIAVENPRGYPMKAYRPPDQIIQPFLFGDSEMKTTYLWLKGLPPLMFTGPIMPKPEPTSIDATGKKRYYTDSRTVKGRAHERSRTFPGIAAAMAEQWGRYVQRRLFPC